MGIINTFLETIRSDLDDDTPRRILADYLAEQGDPRGDLIALQCALYSMSASERRRSPLWSQERQLLEQNESQWIGNLGPLVRQIEFQRGFLRLILDERGIEKRNIRLLLQQDQMLDWVEEIRFVGAVHHFIGLGQALEKLGIPGLDLSNTIHSRIGLGLRDWPPLSTINRLRLDANQIDTVILASLCHDLPFPQLRCLGLADNRLTSRSMLSLVASPVIRTVTRLDLNRNQLEDQGFDYLINDTSTCAGLLQLQVSANRITAAGTISLTSSPYLRHLENLNLSHNPLGDASTAILSHADNLPSLKRLDLSFCDIHDHGALTFVSSPWFQQIECLDLRGNPIDSATVGRLRNHLGSRVLVEDQSERPTPYSFLSDE